MNLQDEMHIDDVIVQQLNNESFLNAGINVDVLRLDKIHSIVSGNKWFKLKYYLQEAIQKKITAVATFGGAFSNHILATAYACNKYDLKCIGFIRGEAPEHYSETLHNAQSLNMQLQFLSREAYSNKKKITEENKLVFFIPEGGYGTTGVKGAAEILQLTPNLSTYNYIICAAGTGIMLAGIANASLPHQECIGVSVMKNNFSLENEMLFLVDDKANPRVKLLHDYHFGGYAKYNQQLIDFMNNIWITQNLPLDFVYTAKALYAIYQLAEKKYFNRDSKILFIHSGGLQGNRSLKNLLIY